MHACSVAFWCEGKTEFFKLLVTLKNLKMTVYDENKEIFTLDGNIGSGKSSVIDELISRDSSIEKAYRETSYSKEPIEKYENCRGRNLLKEFYEDITDDKPKLQAHFPSGKRAKKCNFIAKRFSFTSAP